jgi:hypothetical protein
MYAPRFVDTVSFLMNLDYELLELLELDGGMFIFLRIGMDA